MRGLLTRLGLILVAACGLVATGHGAAFADATCQQTNPATGQCLIWVEAPAKPDDAGPTDSDAPKDSGRGTSCYWDGTHQGISKPPPGPVPCTSKAGYWSNAYNCYIGTVDPQPPAGDPSWKGHEPGDGAVYNCYQPQTDLLIAIWSADTPPNSGAGPSPREVAQLAIDRMDLQAINIGIAPEPGDGNVGIVGMPVWMWAATPDSHTVGPSTASASAGGITVTATARLQRITWDMGGPGSVTPKHQ